MRAMHVVPRNDWEWIPGQFIGPITLGEDVSRHLLPLRLTAEEFDRDGEDTWTRFRSPSWDISILTLNNRITSVTCPSCLFDGKNLVGISEDALIKEIGDREYKVWNHALGRVIEFDELGLEAHMESGFVKAVTVSIDPETISDA